MTRFAGNVLESVIEELLDFFVYFGDFKVHYMTCTGLKLNIEKSNVQCIDRLIKLELWGLRPPCSSSCGGLKDNICPILKVVLLKIGLHSWSETSQVTPKGHMRTKFHDYDCFVISHV